MESNNRQGAAFTKNVFAGRGKVTAAIAQISPVFLDKQRTIEKAIEYIHQAGKGEPISSSSPSCTFGVSVLATRKQ